MLTCFFEDGEKAKGGLRHVTVDAIAVNEKNEVLLVKRAAHLFHPNLFTVPGGFLDRDETTAKGVLRELQEETGYTGEIISLFQINDNPQRPKEDRQTVDFVYIVHITGGQIQINSEVSEISWFGKKDLPEDEEFAFDHRAAIMKYFEYKEKPFALPLIGEMQV